MDSAGTLSRPAEPSSVSDALNFEGHTPDAPKP